MGYGYDYLPLATNRRRNNLWILAGGFLALVTVNFVFLSAILPIRNVLDIYEPLNSISPVHDGSLSATGDDPAMPLIPSPDERAVVTTLYSESFVNATLALGCSIRDVGITARRIVLYFPERVSERSLCQLRAAGWELQSIARIAPPNGGRGVHSRFLDQYSKLRLWSLDTLGIKTVIYLDGDTLVRRNFDELWALPYEFAAVPDVYGDRRGFALSFNAGMLYLHTSSMIFEDMLKKMDSSAYRRVDAEQGFLNMYFATQVLRLPYIYNGNIVIKQRNPEVWRAIEEDMRVVHYTMMKPFIEEERGAVAGELWGEELRIWDSVWQNVNREIEGKC